MASFRFSEWLLQYAARGGSLKTSLTDQKALIFESFLTNVARFLSFLPVFDVFFTRFRGLS
jgi:hypothetical protein